MFTPRDYLSFSQMMLFERSPELYVEQYIYGKKQRISRNIAYGKMLAEGLEDEEATGDPLLDLMMVKLPKFELMDKPIEATLYDRKEPIKLLAKPDTAKADYSAFKEFKTSVRRWTQRMADESGQITFYAFVIWLKTGKIPQDIELVEVQVEYDENSHLRPTGELWRYPTKRTMVDIIRMSGQAKRTWRGIKEICKSELL